MNNEQRAHDLALLVTKYAIEHPKNVEEDITGNASTIDENGVQFIDVYKLYKEKYYQLLDSFNRDF